MEQNYVDLPGGAAMMEQVLKNQTIRAFQKTYTELVDSKHETELKFLKEKVKLDDEDVYFRNPVHELYDFHNLKTYLCQYLEYCR